MPSEVIFPIALFGVLVYFGVFLLSQPASAIRMVGGFMTRLQEFEAAISDEPVGEPVQIDDSRSAQIVVRLFGAAFVCSSLFGAVIRLNGIQ